MSELPHMIKVRISREAKGFLDKRLTTTSDYIRDLISKAMKPKSSTLEEGELMECWSRSYPSQKFVRRLKRRQDEFYMDDEGGRWDNARILK